MAKNDVLIPEEIIDNKELDTTINNTLVKHNVTDTVIASLKDKYGSLRLRDINDKEGYLEIKEAKKEVRQWGILCEKLTKKGREEAVAIQKKWLAKEKEILGKIDEVQKPLESEMKRYEDEIARKDAEEAKRKEEAVINRQAALSKMGAQYQNGCFVLDDVSFDASLIKEADDDVWENSILSKYKVRYEKNEAVRIAEENKRKQEQEDLRKQKEDMDRRERKFADREAALKRAEDDKKKQQEDEQRRRHDIAMEAERAKIRGRQSQLQALGLMYSTQYDSYVYADVAISRVVEIEGMQDEQWDALILKTIPVIERCKKEAEEKRLSDIEEQKRIASEAAAKKERERIAEEQRLSDLKKQQEEQRKQEELNQASDKEKWSAILEQINKIQWHEMKSGPYRRKLSIAKEKISEIQEL